MTTIIPMAAITFVGFFVIAFCGTFALLGLIFLIIGLAVNASMNKKRRQCTAFTEGTVSGMQPQFGSTGLRASYSFSIDGKPLQYVSNYAGNNNLLIGQSVSVYYDPANIGRVYIEEDARQSRMFPRVFTILGCVFFGIALVVAVVLLGVL